jgi:hypothetical protein
MFRFVAFAFLLFLNLCLSHTGSAQFFLGLKSGLQFSGTQFNNPPADAKSKIGFHVGIVASKSIDIRKRMFLTSEILYTQKGYQSTLFRSGSSYLEIPLLLRMQFNILKKQGLTFFVNGGPYIGIAFGQTNTADSATAYASNYFAEKKFEIGVAAGAGFMYPLNIKDMPARVFLEGRFVQGLTTLAEKEQLRNQSTMISLGILLAPSFLNSSKDQTTFEAAP